MVRNAPCSQIMRSTALALMMKQANGASERVHRGTQTEESVRIRVCEVGMGSAWCFVTAALFLPVRVAALTRPAVSGKTKTGRRHHLWSLKSLASTFPKSSPASCPSFPARCVTVAACWVCRM